MSKQVGVDIAEMRSEIAKLTKRVPASFNRRYLQIRLSSLRRLAPDELPRAQAIDRAVPLTISLGEKHRDLVVKMAAREKISVSSLARIAIDEYAARHGFGTDLEKVRTG